MATQHRHDEAQRRLKERRWATIHQPGQFDNAEEPKNISPMICPVL